MRMNTRKIAEEYRLQQWAGIIKECKESGLSVREYCKYKKIKENKYFYWQKKLRETVCYEIMNEQEKATNMISAKIGKITNINNEKHETEESGNRHPIMWAHIDPKNIEKPITIGKNNISINRDGWTITVEPGVDTGLLTETLRAVSQVCY